MKIELEFPDVIDGPCVNQEFLQGMVDRMAVSYFKYGAVTAEAIAKRNMIETIQLRFDTYLKDHNTEWLMDVANFCMIEFMCPSFVDSHFKPTDSIESPGYVLKDGRQSWAHERDLL